MLPQLEVFSVPWLVLVLRLPRRWALRASIARAAFWPVLSRR